MNKSVSASTCKSVDEFATKIATTSGKTERAALFQKMRESYSAAEVAAAFYRATRTIDKCKVVAALDFLAETTSCNNVQTIASYYFKTGMGGADKVTCELASLFADLGYRSVLFCDETVDRNLVSPDVECVVLPPFQKCNPDNYIERAEALQDALESYEVDAFVYHQWLSHVLPWDLTVAKLLDVRFIVHAHGSCIVLPRYRVDDFYTLPISYRYVDAIVCLSDFDCTFWSQSNQFAHRTINPARYLTAETPRAALEGQNVLWIGRLDPIEKRPDEALKVMRELHAMLPDATLTIVGGGTPEYEQSLAETAEHYGIAGCVRFCGEQEDPRPFYEQASALLITSPFEGYSIVLAESKVYGLPCVLYDLPNIIFVEQPHGTITVPQLDCHSAAAELAHILTDDDYRQKLGASSRIQAEDLESFDRAAFWKGVLEDTAIPYVPADAMAAQNHLWNLFWQESGASMRDANARMGALDARVAEQNGRILELERKIDELETSTSMRVGLAATVIPRKIKDRLSRK